MIWHLLKYWVTFILPAFYKRIQGNNLKNIRIKGPAIIAMNHPNAFTDPVAFTYLCYPLRLKYLARGDAFKPGIVAWLLRQIGIVPIFRLQDGGLEGLQKNDLAYREVNNLLRKNFKIIVFAEGVCVQERRLRPLKKGVARMIFGAYDALKSENLVVIPVGVNYSQPNKIGSTIFYNVGEPIAVKQFIGQYRENAAKAQLALLQTLYPRMKELITHIENKDYDEVVCQVEILKKAEILKERGLNSNDLANDFEVLKQITGIVNVAVEKNRPVVDEFKSNAAVYFSELKKLRIDDWLIDPIQNKRVTMFYFFLRAILVCFGFPIYAVGLLSNYLPFVVTKKIVQNIVKGKVEFYSSLFIGFAMLFFMINYLVIFTISYVALDNLLLTIVICAALALCALFCVHFHPFLLNTFELLRILKNKNGSADLREKRKYLVSLINKF